jgi:hypothetical protein
MSASLLSEASHLPVNSGRRGAKFSEPGARLEDHSHTGVVSIVTESAQQVSCCAPISFLDNDPSPSVSDTPGKRSKKSEKTVRDLLLLFQR